MERPIGTKVEYKGKSYVVALNPNPGYCDFCNIKDCEGSTGRRVLGNCSAMWRKDKTSVVFIEIKSNNMDKECKKIYLSLPISGRDINEQKDLVKEWKEKLSKKYPNSIIISPFDVCSVTDEILPYEYFLSRCIEILMKCDLVVFHKDFEDSKGCMTEMFICKTYNIKFVINEDGFLEEKIKEFLTNIMDSDLVELIEDVQGNSLIKYFEDLYWKDRLKKEEKELLYEKITEHIENILQVDYESMDSIDAPLKKELIYSLYLLKKE